MPGYLLDPASYASGISISASGNISAQNVQDAVYELDSEKADGASTTSALALKAPLASPTFTGTVSASVANISSNLTVDTNTLFVDAANNRVGIGTISPTQSLHVEGNSFLNGETVVGRSNSVDEGGQVSFARASDNSAYWNVDAFGSASTPSLRFFNDGTVKMQIDSSGRITTPNQPMFFVYRGAGNTTLTGTGNILVPLDTKSYDVGSNYNASTYRFTAPIGGKYLFTFHLNIYGVTSNTFNAALRINGSTLHYGTRVITSSTGDWNSAVSAVVNLSANDYVEPIAYIGTATASISGGSATWNFFSGFLVG